MTGRLTIWSCFLCENETLQWKNRTCSCESAPFNQSNCSSTATHVYHRQTKRKWNWKWTWMDLIILQIYYRNMPHVEIGEPRWAIYPKIYSKATKEKWMDWSKNVMFLIFGFLDFWIICSKYPKIQSNFSIFPYRNHSIWAFGRQKGITSSYRWSTYREKLTLISS